MQIFYFAMIIFLFYFQFKELCLKRKVEDIKQGKEVFKIKFSCGEYEIEDRHRITRFGNCAIIIMKHYRFDGS